jgi:hypothetical protein
VIIKKTVTALRLTRTPRRTSCHPKKRSSVGMGEPAFFEGHKRKDAPTLYLSVYDGCV